MRTRIAPASACQASSSAAAVASRPTLSRALPTAKKGMKKETVQAANIVTNQALVADRLTWSGA